MVRGEWDRTYLPCTPLGIVELLVRSGIAIERQDVVIVGRGHLVGLPLAVMLAQKMPNANATTPVRSFIFLRSVLFGGAKIPPGQSGARMPKPAA